MTEHSSYDDLEGRIQKLLEEVKSLRDQKSILQGVQDAFDPLLFKEKEEKADKLRTEYLSKLSHEIRTPLSAIAGYSKLIDSPTIDEGKRENYASNINKNSKILFNLIDDIIDIAKYKVEQNRIIKYQNDLIEIHRSLVTHQRDKITSQAEKITDSIRYASLIQSAILPPKDKLDQYITDFFILFRPTDIVSGDFFWINEKDENIYLSVADCTGHGVPGALMSMLGVALLNEIIIKDEIKKPDEILNQLRENLMNSLHQTGKPGEAKDGMDIAICVINKKRNMLEFAGAFNPMYVSRAGEIIEIKGDRMPIGIHMNAHMPFTRHEVKLKKSDIIYLFSDGYLDQFGGAKDKKFSATQFKKLLAEISHESMEKQKEILDKTINDWMDDEEQIDDILVMGIKI
jgi:serine phosphatase RsbU (regulator of sigma subunit)